MKFRRFEAQTCVDYRCRKVQKKHRHIWEKKQQKNKTKTATKVTKITDIILPILPVQELQRYQLHHYPTDAPPLRCTTQAGLCPSLPRNRFSDPCVMSLRGVGLLGSKTRDYTPALPIPETDSRACCNLSSTFLHQSLLTAKQHGGAVLFTLPRATDFRVVGCRCFAVCLHG